MPPPMPALTSATTTHVLHATTHALRAYDVGQRAGSIQLLMTTVRRQHAALEFAQREDGVPLQEPARRLTHRQVTAANSELATLE